jgi:glycosyltransferase involved in cell wall biosynthesis
MRGLKYISWADSTGYAVAAKSYVRALIDAGTPLTWTPMLAGQNGYEARAGTAWPCPRLTTVCNRPLDYDTVLIHTVPEYYPALIERERRAGRRILGYTVWELETLPRHWPAILNRLDALIVPCRWNVDVFRSSGVSVPIHVVPHLPQCADLPAPDDAARAALRARLGGEGSWRDRFVFYAVGFWSNRKGLDLALEAYWRAFDADDPVLMVVKTGAEDITRWRRHWRSGFRRRHPTAQQSAAALAARHRRPAPWRVIADESLSDAEMLALHERGDCFVSLTRTEGWGLGAFEAARLGKPVVMTGYGGQLDYLGRDHAWLVDYDMVPVREPAWDERYKSGDRWAEPSVPQAARHLRAVFADRDAARGRARLQAERIARDFSKTKVVQALLAALSRPGAS